MMVHFINDRFVWDSKTCILCGRDGRNDPPEEWAKWAFILPPMKNGLRQVIAVCPLCKSGLKIDCVDLPTLDLDMLFP